MIAPARPPGRRRARRTVATGVALVATVLVLAGCGVPAERTASIVDAADVPFGLLDDAAPAPSTTTVGSTAVVFLAAGEQLVAVDRPVPPDASLADLLEVVAAGATPQEAALGLSSYLPDGQVGAVASSRGVAVVDLRASFAALSPRDQAAAIAQIVFTLTGRPGIGRVGFTLDGASIEVPRGDGALTTDALARDDFPGIVS